MLILIDSILDLTKIEAGKTVFEYQSIDINTLIDEVVTTINPMVDKGENTLILSCEDDLGLACIDQTRVKQMLFNLLSNSCKFTNNGKISLTAYKEKNDNQEWICFKVKDTGIGIPLDKIESLFQPFVQADISTTRLYGGTGLGLTIIKHFITLMGGVINVNSAAGKGTTFYIKLPINNALC